MVAFARPYKYILLAICILVALGTVVQSQRHLLKDWIVSESQDTHKSVEQATTATTATDAASTTTPEKGSMKEKAVIWSMARNSDLESMLSSIGYVEIRFNSQFHYDWVFVNDEEFTQEFKEKVSKAVSGKAIFDQISEKFWKIPDWVDKDRLQQQMKEMEAAKTSRPNQDCPEVESTYEKLHCNCKPKQNFSAHPPSCAIRFTLAKDAYQPLLEAKTKLKEDVLKSTSELTKEQLQVELIKAKLAEFNQHEAFAQAVKAKGVVQDKLNKCKKG